MLSLTIKNTLRDDQDFYNLTKVKVYFIRPACPVTKEFLASQETDIVLSLTAKQHLGEQTKSADEFQSKVEELFQLETAPQCSDIDFGFTPDLDVPFSFDNDPETMNLTLDPSLDDNEGTYVSKQFKVFYKDFPEIVW